MIDQLKQQAEGGSFQPSRYFSGETASPFFGVSHALSNKIDTQGRV